MNELGEWLARAREARGLTLEDAERDTRISRRYLQALESGDLDIIPAPVYARGFLRSYAQYLGLNPQEAMERYPRDDGPPGISRVHTAAPQRGAPRQAPREDQMAAYAENRPSWRRPGPMTPPSAERLAAPERPVAERAAPAPPPRREPPPAREPERRLPPPEDDGYYDEGPTIGADIAVPVPARKIKQDPAAQTRSTVVLAVAVVAIGIIVLLALGISRLGDDSDGLGFLPTVENGGTDAGDQPDGGFPDLDDGDATPAPIDDGEDNGQPAPSGIVPAVEGDTEENAIAAIEAAGLVPNIRYEPTEGTPGTVLTQSPGAGTQRSPGEPVTIIVSEEP